MYQHLVTFWAMLKMKEEKEWCVCIFFIKFGKNGAVTFSVLKDAFGDECWSHAYAFK
jgi:hypothetical protein